jgi:hypothetical protein
VSFLFYSIPFFGGDGGGLTNGCSGIVGFLSVVCVREYRAWKRGRNANANVEGGYKAGDVV